MRFYLCLFLAVVLALHVHCEHHRRPHGRHKRPHLKAFRHDTATDEPEMEKEGHSTSYEYGDTEEGDVSVEGEDVGSGQKPHPVHSVTNGCFNKLTGNHVKEEGFEFHPPTCMLCRCSMGRLHCVEACQEDFDQDAEGLVNYSDANEDEE